MKHLLSTLSAALLILAAASCAGHHEFANPIPVKLGDPYLLCAADGNFYLYGTSEGVKGFNVYRSTDLQAWDSLGLAFDAKIQEKAWGKNCFWAPEVYERDGKYYMFYSANWKENPNNDLEVFRIGVAAADSPAGPFQNISDGPVFDPGYPIIDANVLFDDATGKTYLYYSRCCYKHAVESELATWAREQGLYDEIEESWVYGVEMLPDFSGVVGEPVLLLCPPSTMEDVQAEWESRSVTNKEINRRWTEGSFIFKDKDTYYMMYSANHYAGQYYAVGYATSDNPLGPFTKSDTNPVIQKNGVVTGTGHCMAASMPDGSRLCVYHGRSSETGNARIVFMDKLSIQPDGHLVVEGPTFGETIQLKF